MVPLERRIARGVRQTTLHAASCAGPQVAVMNLLTAVIVEGSMDQARSDREIQEVPCF